jgi:hypothetical protein
MPRWITVRRPFDYHWPSRAITAFSENDLGEHFVKDELADFALMEGHATEGKVDAAARSRKSLGKRAVRRHPKGPRAAKTAHDRSDDAVAQPGLADADRSADRGSGGS